MGTTFGSNHNICFLLLVVLLINSSKGMSGCSVNDGYQPHKGNQLHKAEAVQMCILVFVFLSVD